MTQRPRVVFLFSDTGGGHRSATEAIIEAIRLEYGDRIDLVMVDLFKSYSPFPFNRFPDWYPWMIRMPFFWQFNWHAWDGVRRVRWMNRLAWPRLRSKLRQFLRQIQADVIVSVHPASNTPVLQALGPNHPPFLTVVTDPVSLHAIWIDPRADGCAVGTETARRKAIRFGLPAEKVHVTGLPVARRFCDQSLVDPQALREQLGWPQDRPVVLLVGGGEGMGPIEKNALALAHSGLKMGLAIVAGRNWGLHERLEKHVWPVPTFIYGFIHNMPELMAAADMLVTKAGPGTIMEAVNLGLPLILYSRIPGQEDGNVRYVASEGAGVWAPQPARVVAAVRTWVEQPELRLAAARACRRIARPDAAQKIAKLIVEMIRF